MRFLVDQNLSPLVAVGLTAAGHDAVHTSGLGLGRAADPVILDRADAEHRVVLSADTDFGALLALRAATGPSVLLLRRQTGRRAEQVTQLILANLPAIEDALVAGAIVVLDADRIRIRSLPIR